MIEFTPQDRVELAHTSDEDTTLRPGDRGTVADVDAAGTVHIVWDNGRTLGLSPGGEDRVRVLNTTPAPTARSVGRAPSSRA